MQQIHGFTNKDPYTEVTADGDRSDAPFSGYQITDTLIGISETVSVTLTPLPYYTLTDLGSLSDPLGGGQWNAVTHTFTETGISTGTPTSATQILDRLVYTPPTLNAGQGETILATVSVDGQTDPKGPVRLETVTAPAITGTVANEPVASGSTIRPFATTVVTDGNFSSDTTLMATITLTDGGVATDNDGLLSGNGLSKTGTGTYTLSGNYGLYGLQSLVFTPTAADGGTTRNTAFDLSVLDVGAALSTDNRQTSVMVIGSTVTASVPLIAGTWGTQTVAANGTIKPFSAVTLSDTNVTPLDNVTLTVSGGGTLSGQGLSGGANGIYVIAAASPQAMTAILNALTFTPPALAASQTSNTINIRLDVADGTQVATDTKTLIDEVAVLPPQPVTPSPNDTVVLVGSGGSIIDADDNVWTIDSNDKVAINAVEDFNTGNVIELAYVNGTIWQENSDKLWWGETSPNDSWAPNAGTADSPLTSLTPTAPPTLPSTPGLGILDTTIGQPLAAAARTYTGPVAGLISEYVTTTADSLNLTVTTPGWFIHTGSGNDAIVVSSGTNVLDGSTGSNFLTGGTGNDTFFVDDRGPTSNTWSTVNNFHSGDSATIWGVTPDDFNLVWLDGQGAAGYAGLTLGVTSAGKPDANLTLVGFTNADLTNGKLTISYGTTAATDGVPGSAFMYVQAN